MSYISEHKAAFGLVALLLATVSASELIMHNASNSPTDSALNKSEKTILLSEQYISTENVDNPKIKSWFKWGDDGLAAHAAQEVVDTQDGADAIQLMGDWFKNGDVAQTAMHGGEIAYQFTVADGGVYTVFIESQNYMSLDIGTAPTCSSSADCDASCADHFTCMSVTWCNCDCISECMRDHEFKNIALTDASGTPIRTYLNVTVPSTNTPQGWKVELGPLESGTYRLAFTNGRDGAFNTPAGDYDMNVQINQVQFVRTTIEEGTVSSGGTDVIGVRAYSNPEYLSLLEWYNTYAPNPGSPEITTVNGFPALVDGDTTYILGFNLIDREELDCWGIDGCAGGIPSSGP